MRFQASSKWVAAGLGILMAMGVQASAQGDAVSEASAKNKTNGVRGCPAFDVDTLPTKTYYLKNGGQPSDGNEMLTGLRLMLNPMTKLYLVPSQDSIVIRGCPEDLVLAQKILDDLDRPRKRFRLDFAVTEVDAGKRLGVQHVSLFVEEGQRSTLKSGSKVPVVTGPQMTYLDIGTNFDVTTSSAAGDGVMLKSRFEQSNVVEEKSGAGPQDPIVRQTVLESVSLLKEGKPQVLGAIDIAGSTRRLEIEVVAELVK